MQMSEGGDEGYAWKAVGLEATPALATNTQPPPSEALFFILLTEPICRPYPHVRVHILCDTSIHEQFTEVCEIILINFLLSCTSLSYQQKQINGK